jgi:pimeloyl-ACP methyl ester carboxylesterase
MEATTRSVPGEDGETILVEEFGEPDGKPVLVNPGSPGSRRLFRPDAELAVQEFGLRLLSYDRPGYGGRPRRTGRQVADAAWRPRTTMTEWFGAFGPGLPSSVPRTGPWRLQACVHVSD